VGGPFGAGPLEWGPPSVGIPLSGGPLEWGPLGCELSWVQAPLGGGPLEPAWVRAPMTASSRVSTMKLWNNNPFNNEIAAIKNFILSSSVINFMIKIPCINKNLAIKNKIFVP
jgi:hypothetical protein